MRTGLRERSLHRLLRPLSRSRVKVFGGSETAFESCHSAEVCPSEYFSWPHRAPEPRPVNLNPANPSSSL